MTGIPERALWAAAAALAIHDHSRLIAAARKRRDRIHLDGEPVVVGSVERETADARAYFYGPDWAEVAACAGLRCDPEQALQTAIAGRLVMFDTAQHTSRPCSYAGLEFRSRKALAAYLGITEDTVARIRRRRGDEGIEARVEAMQRRAERPTAEA